MDKKPFVYFEMDKRVITEHQCSITTRVYGTLRGTEELTHKPDGVERIAEIIKEFPHCSEFTVTAGEDVKIVLREETKIKEFPSMGTYSKDRLQNTDGLFGIFDLRENSPY